MITRLPITIGRPEAPTRTTLSRQVDAPIVTEPSASPTGRCMPSEPTLSGSLLDKSTWRMKLESGATLGSVTCSMFMLWIPGTLKVGSGQKEADPHQEVRPRHHRLELQSRVYQASCPRARFDQKHGRRAARRVDREESQGEQGAGHGLANGHEPSHSRHVSDRGRHE